jgi:hypothetical protein
MAGRRPAIARKDVAVKLTATSFSSRKLQATVDIQAPLPVVWEALTDYERLGTFIPSLVENKCLERRKQGCLLYQVRTCAVANPCGLVAQHSWALPQTFLHVQNTVDRMQCR